MKYHPNEVVRKIVPMAACKALTELNDGTIVDEDDLQAVVETLKSLVTVLKVAADQGNLDPDRLESIGCIVNKLNQIVR